MSELKEIKVLLTEDRFSQICKVGFFTHMTELGRFEIPFNKLDILKLTKGEILTKQVDEDLVKFLLQDIGMENIREIVKRSPIFYELSNQI